MQIRRAGVSRRFPWNVSLLAFGLILALPMLVPAEAQQSPPAKNPAIARNMKAIGKNLQQLMTLAGDAEEAKKSLRLIHDMQRKMLAVKTKKPAMVKAAPKDEQEKLVTEFRIMANRMLTEMLQVELALLEGKHAAAAERITGSLADLVREAHGKFRQR